MATQDDIYRALEYMLCHKIGKPLSLKQHHLETITDNFSKDNLIGHGGYGVVYKGVVGDGLVAVKKLHSAQAIEDEPFKREVDCLMNIRHHNIVLFVGYCCETQEVVMPQEGKHIFVEKRERLLCFEYLRNGSLHRYLTAGPCELPWHVCYQIIKGICLGLHYLHKKRIINLDLKPDNILLDDGMVPKIADFGLSRLLGDEISRMITQQKHGTLGYMAPEYIDDGVITIKSDIYSLGVIIRHMVKGRNSGDTTDEDILESWMIKLENDSSQTRPQTQFLEIGYKEQIKACIEILQRCTRPEPKDRPTTEDILLTLEETEARVKLMVAVPTRNASQLELVKFGPWGGDGGKPRDIKMVPYHLDTVTISSGVTIDSIEFSYTDHDGQYHNTGPWGGHGGHNDTIQLGSSEFLIGVSGTIGPFGSLKNTITSLMFVTNTRSYGPFGEGQGAPFHIQMQNTGRIVGFFGRSNRYLNAIGIYTNQDARVAGIGPLGGDGGVLRDIIDHNGQQHSIGPSVECGGSDHKHDVHAKFGPWGGDGGNLLDIKMLPYQLDGVKISSGVIIDSVEFSYSDYDGQYHTTGPWGGHGGDNNYIQLGPLEFLTGVSGTIGPYRNLTNVITSLTFVSNTRSYGPFGEGGGTTFNIQMQNNGRIVGFFGRSNRYLNAIGVYTNQDARVIRIGPFGGYEGVLHDMIEHNGLHHSVGPSGECGGSDHKPDVYSKFGPWGGDGGEPQDIKMLPYHLDRVTISSGLIIDSIEFSYTDRNGQYHTTGPWGGHGGDINSILLGPSEFLTGVSGSIGTFNSQLNVITSLTFVTNARSYGPFGEGRGTSFHIPMQCNGCIVGFFGRSGQYLNAIGVYTNPELRVIRKEQAEVDRIGPWGGDGNVLHDITEKPHHLQRVTIFSGSIINSLEYLYSDNNGQQHTAGPWGGCGGDGRKIQLDPEEFIVKVTGTFHPCAWNTSIPNVVSSLTFVTNTGKRHGPFGSAAFHVPMGSKRNSRIVGFFAHGDNYIEAIGAYFRTV